MSNRINLRVNQRNPAARWGCTAADSGDGSSRLSVSVTSRRYVKAFLSYESPRLIICFGLATPQTGGKLPLLSLSHFLEFSVRAFVFSQITTEISLTRNRSGVKIWYFNRISFSPTDNQYIMSIHRTSTLCLTVLFKTPGEGWDVVL